jgi:1-acyl-sn-glycerol-3-phosphate acyltransferase
LILLATPHTAEYDLPALLLPFFVYAPRFLQTRIGAVIWGLLLWVPWLSWALFQMMGLTTSQWYAAYWFHYPQILVLALLAFLAVTRRMAGVVYNQTAQDIMEI